MLFLLLDIQPTVLYSYCLCILLCNIIYYIANMTFQTLRNYNAY